MYGAYSKETGNKLIFKEPFATLDLQVSGSENIASIKVENVAGTPIAGVASWLPSTGLKMKEGLPFVNLNCTNNGDFVKLTDDAHFYLVLAPAEYKKGLKVTITDSTHKAVEHTISSINLLAGKVTTSQIKYAVDEDLLYYESFDNCVWGGNIVGGQTCFGYAPNGTTVKESNELGRDGYANAFVKVPYNNAGTAFIQSNTYNDVDGKTVATSHILTDSYINSRNFGDYTYLFRCQEHQGYIVCGAANTGRGMFELAPLKSIKTIENIKVTFDFCYQFGSNDLLDFLVLNGGNIASIKIDGKDIALDADHYSFLSATSQFSVDKTYAPVPSSEAEAKQWHKVEAVVENATDGTILHWRGHNANSGVHGFYIDNIVVRTIGSSFNHDKNTLRVLYWNIQNGMWSDQANNYDNFVEWVKKYDPDVCVWCESSSIYYDNTYTSAPSSERFLPNGWAALAARYGHSYVAVGGWRDNYPQTVTSKYPIKTLLKITDSDVANKPISHGAAIQQIEINGEVINFVTLHTWPQAYAYGVSGTDARNASAAAHEGDYYREFEMKYICQHTYLDSTYASTQNWLMMGDFNSRSRVDNWYYGYPDNDTAFLVHNYILDNTDYVDIIKEQYPDRFIASTAGASRIDYMYASPSMYKKVNNSMIVIDKWTTPHKSKVVPDFYDPSDHRPILVDFNLN